MVIIRKGFMREGVRKSDLGAANCSHCCNVDTAPITCKEQVSIEQMMQIAYLSLLFIKKPSQACRDVQEAPHGEILIFCQVRGLISLS